MNREKETRKIVDILLIEDDPGDVRLTQEALKDSKIYVRLSVVGDGVEAMEFLRRQGKYSNATKPDLIFLDLNLPRKDGREVLDEIKQDADLKRIPVVILTSSQAEEDIVKSYNHYANCYITKPVNIDQFQKVVKAIDCFWFSLVKLPEK